MMEDDKYYIAELSEDMRIKIFVLQSILKDRKIDASASETLDLALDVLKEVLDGQGFDKVAICK